MDLLDIEIRPGSGFDIADIHNSLRLIDDQGPIGRKKLAEGVGVGEGSVRSLLDILKSEGYVNSTPNGHILTEKGMEELADMDKRMVQLDAGEITVGEADVAMIVRGASNAVGKGVSIRDEAIKAGAAGATTIIFENGDFEFPDMKLEVESKIKRKLEEKFQLEDGDAVIIGSSDNRIDAERGTLAGARYLSKFET